MWIASKNVNSTDGTDLKQNLFTAQQLHQNFCLRALINKQKKH